MESMEMNQWQLSKTYCNPKCQNNSIKTNKFNIMTDANNNKKQKTTFMTKMLEGLQELETLKIRTIVGELKYDAKKESYVHDEGQYVEGIISEIHLAKGDIDTRMTQKFAGEFDALREYHQTKEIQGQEIIRKNIELIQEIAKTIVELGKEIAKQPA